MRTTVGLRTRLPQRYKADMDYLGRIMMSFKEDDWRPRWLVEKELPVGETWGMAPFSHLWAGWEFGKSSCPAFLSRRTTRIHSVPGIIIALFPTNRLTACIWFPTWIACSFQKVLLQSFNSNFETVAILRYIGTVLSIYMYIDEMTSILPFHPLFPSIENT